MPLPAVKVVLFEAGHVSTAGVGEAAVDDAVLAAPGGLLDVLPKLAEASADEAAEDEPSVTSRAPQTPPLSTAAPTLLLR